MNWLSFHMSYLNQKLKIFIYAFIHGNGCTILTSLPEAGKSSASSVHHKIWYWGARCLLSPHCISSAQLFRYTSLIASCRCNLIKLDYKFQLVPRAISFCLSQIILLPKCLFYYQHLVWSKCINQRYNYNYTLMQQGNKAKQNHLFKQYTFGLITEYPCEKVCHWYTNIYLWSLSVVVLAILN